MRHRHGQKRLGRPTDQRIAILKSLVAGLLSHEYLTTTEVRAKEVRPVIEKLITLAKEDTISNRRLARRWIPMGKTITTREKYENVTGDAPTYAGVLKGAERRPSGEILLKKLFAEIGPKYKDRPGGYLRLTRLGGESHVNAKGELTIRSARRGDAATLIKIEMVD
ncbi:MAG TPA: 50S ribosomal protein L17 [Armatimonadota bacterium]|jgi:large subunit ribosomal protein L17